MEDKLKKEWKKHKVSKGSEGKFSLYQNGIKNTFPDKSIEIKDFLEILKDDTLTKKKIRSETNKEKRNVLKSKLSYVTFTGTFTARGNKNLIKSSGFASFDLDDMEDLEGARQKLILDKYVHLCFISPSGNGLKFIVKIPEVKDDEEYKKYWNSIARYYDFKDNDESVKDIARACYISFNPDYYFNPNSEVYSEKEEKEPYISKSEDKVILNEKERKENKNEENLETDFQEICKSKISISDVLSLFNIDTSKNPTECPFHSSKGGQCLGFTEDTAHCFHCEGKWNIFSLVMEYKKFDFKETLEFFAEKFNLKDEFEKCKKNYKKKLKEKREEEKNTRHISYYVNEDKKIILEQIYSKENGSLFCKYDDNTQKIEYLKSFKIGELKYMPQEGEEIKKKAVLLSTKPEEYIDDTTLDKKIISFIHKWLDVPEEIERFGLWNIKRSWVYQKFHTLNYLRALGDIGTGKSRFLDTFGYLHYKPIFTTGSTTSAPLFRIIDKWKGTLVMDEADLQRSDESDQIIKIINQGYEKGRFIMRCDQNDATKLNFFDPYCPKILATRKPYTDKATESRCLTHVLDVTERQDIPLNLNEEFFREADKIRNMLLMWRFRNYFHIDMKLKYDLGDLEPRVKQIVSSYISLFSNDVKQMEIFKNYISNYQENLVYERQTSFDGIIIGVIHSFIEMNNLSFSAGDIIDKGEFTTRTGKKMAPQSLNPYLKSLGFKKSDIVTIDGKTKRIIPIDQKHLIKIFTRYGYEITNITKFTTLTGREQKSNICIKEVKEDINTEIKVTPPAIRNGCKLRNLRNFNWSDEDTKRLENANKKEQEKKE